MKYCDKIKIYHRTVIPAAVVKICHDDKAFLGVKTEKISDYGGMVDLKPGEEVILDFNDHLVGYLNFKATYNGLIQDAPLMLEFTLGETLRELDGIEAYNGKLSKSWIQTERLAIEFLPFSGKLNRRYTFRYLKIKRLDTVCNKCVLTDILCDAVTSADISRLKSLDSGDKVLDKIYKVASLTLMDCEQSVYEDGPKRDRRLWMGDMRLQALADYASFKNIKLTEKCLRLFANNLIEGRIVPQCIYENSPPFKDKWFLTDYSLLFISALYDYMSYEKSDINLVKELYPVSKMQAEFADEKTDYVRGRINAPFFIDWCPGLNSSTANFGVYLYALRHLKSIAEYIGEQTEWIDGKISAVSDIILENYNADQHRFTDTDCKGSWAAGIWGVLSGVLDRKEAQKVLETLETDDPELKIGTPYLASYYVEALCVCGMKEAAIKIIRKYWGKMLEAGLDRFPEYLIDTENRSEYYNEITNSYCHAWSATPVYFLGKMFSK